MQNWIDTERIEKLSEMDKKVPLHNKVIKLQEETGELAQAYLKYSKSSNVSASASGSKTDVLEEACDVINVAIDIINNLGLTNEEKEKMFSSKLDKWERKMTPKFNSDYEEIEYLCKVHKELHGENFSVFSVFEDFLKSKGETTVLRSIKA